MNQKMNNVSKKKRRFAKLRNVYLTFGFAENYNCLQILIDP